MGSPSMRFSLISPPPVFSSLASTPTTLSMMLPGTPVVRAPSTPSAFLLPAASVSTVLIQSGCRSVPSKEDENSVEPAALVGAAARAVAGSATEAATAATATMIVHRDFPRGRHSVMGPPQSPHMTAMSRLLAKPHLTTLSRCQRKLRRVTGRLGAGRQLLIPGTGRRGRRTRRSPAPSTGGPAGVLGARGHRRAEIQLRAVSDAQGQVGPRRHRRRSGGRYSRTES